MAMKQLDEIREKIEDVIKENFPFYTSYKINLRDEYYWKISITYYYMEEEMNLIQVIPIDVSERECFLTEFKDFLLNVRKDLILAGA